MLIFVSFPTFLLFLVLNWKCIISFQLTNPKVSRNVFPTTTCVLKSKPLDSTDWNCFLVNKELSFKERQELVGYYEKGDMILDNLAARLMYGDLKQNNTSFSEEWNKFLEQSPKWSFTQNNDQQAIFFNNKQYQNVPGLKILRKQNVKMGLCHMLAPITFQHYHIIINSAGKQQGTLDTGLFKGKMLAGTQLYKFIKSTIQNEGDCAFEFLKTIRGVDDFSSLLFPSKTNHFLNYDDCYNCIIKQLVDYPGLVTGFEVHHDFWDRFCVSYKRKPSPGNFYNRRGTHSMVLIGARYDPDERDYYLLLQNTWEEKYFIEVSGEYINFCNAALYFLEKEINQFDLNFPINHFECAETIDCAEILYGVEVWK